MATSGRLNDFSRYNEHGQSSPHVWMLIQPHQKPQSLGHWSYFGGARAAWLNVLSSKSNQYRIGIGKLDEKIRKKFLECSSIPICHSRFNHA